MNKYTRISLIFILVAGIVFFLVDFRLENIEIYNDSIYTDEEIEKKLFTGGKTDNYTYFFAYRINHSSADIPFVEKADVEVLDRNSVKIYVYGKIVTGCVEHMGNYVHFDREGKVVESARSPLEGIPVIEGLSFDSVVMGKKLEIGDSDTFDEVLSILKLLEKNSLTAERIVYGQRGDITLFIGKDEVLLGTEGDLDYKINNLPNVLQAMSDEGETGGCRYDMRKYSEENREVTVKIIGQ